MGNTALNVRGGGDLAGTRPDLAGRRGEQSSLINDKSISEAAARRLTLG